MQAVAKKKSPDLLKPEVIAADRNRCIGIITVDFVSPFYAQIIEGTCNYLNARGYRAMVQPNLRDHRGSRTLNNCHIDKMQCDGLVIHAHSFSEDTLNALMSRYDTAVLLNRHLSKFPGKCVYTDNLQGGRLAAKCLLDHGHQDIAMITGPSRFFESHDRAMGFESELEQHAHSIKLTLEGDFHEGSGAKCMDAILDSTHKISAVFIQNDEMAFGALNSCRKRGIRVPEDISIIGYDGLAMCDFVAPKLTSIQQPLRQLGENAARILCEMLAGDNTCLYEKAHAYEPVLAERESVAPPLGSSPSDTMLTSREIECLTWTARGKTSWEISVILGISESTATFHLRNTVVKMQASNRTHAVAKGLQSGLIKL